MLNHRYDVRSMASACSFGVIGMNCPVFESSDRCLNKAGLVERVGVDQALYILFVAYTQARINGLGCSAPIFVKFQATSSSLSLLPQSVRISVVALSCDTNVHWQLI